MNDKAVIAFFLGIMMGTLILALLMNIISPNLNSNIGLSQEAGDLVCQRITNNSNAIAVDWRNKYDEPRDSLICKIREETNAGGFIQVISG